MWLYMYKKPTVSCISLPDLPLSYIVFGNSSFKVAEITNTLSKIESSKSVASEFCFSSEVYNGTAVIFSDIVDGIFVSASIGIIGAGELRTKWSQFQNCRL